MPKILRTLSFTHSGVSYLGRIAMHRDDLREKSPEHRRRHTAAPPPQPLSRRSLAARQIQVTRGCKGDSVFFFQQETSVHCMHRPAGTGLDRDWAGLGCSACFFPLAYHRRPCLLHLDTDVGQFFIRCTFRLQAALQSAGPCKIFDTYLCGSRQSAISMR